MDRTIPLERFDDMPVMAPQILQEPDNQPGTNIVRLNLNENPLPPSPNAIAAMHDAVNIANRYPDHSCSALAQIISARIGIGTDRLAFGNGSGEMLFAAAAIAVDRNEQAVLPGPTFAPVGKNVRLAGGEVVTVPVLDNGSNNVSGMLDAISEHTALFYLCTPNSPTGGMLEAEQIIIRAVDECMAAMKPGVAAGEIDKIARDVLSTNSFGAEQATRTGYSIGIAFAPDWGEGHIISLQKNDPRLLQENMGFHLIPWIQIPGVAAIGISETVQVTPSGAKSFFNFERRLFSK